MDVQQDARRLLLALFVLSQTVVAQENPITDFKLLGNIDVQAKPGDKTEIIVSAQASASGELRLELAGLRPPFLDGWDNKSIQCEKGCWISDTLIVAPGHNDYGDHSFSVTASFFDKGVLLEERRRRVRIAVKPKMLPEPQFTAGTSNQLSWTPLEDNFLYRLQRITGPQSISLRKPGASIVHSAELLFDSTDVVENLPEGVKFGYYVEAEDLQRGVSYSSDVVYSTQDHSPPPVVELQRFSVESDASVELEWNVAKDAVSYIENYIIYRKQINLTTEVFAAIDTLPFFPVHNIEPINYFPIRAQEGLSIYVADNDSLFTGMPGEILIERLPRELNGLTMIKTSVKDRWNADEDFLTFDLHDDARIYIAFDVQFGHAVVPNWISDAFFDLKEDIQTNSGMFHVYKSRQIVSAGRVSLGGNFAVNANHINPRTYVVFIEPVNREFPVSQGSTIVYSDPLGFGNNLNTYQYLVKAEDVVGNVGEGIPSPPVIIDVGGRCRPVISSWFDYRSNAGHRFHRGFSNTMSINDPATDMNCDGLQNADSLLFQAVRESVTLFSNHTESKKGTEFFDSGWVSVRDLEPRLTYEFDFLANGSEPDFVNGKTWYYRVRAKDVDGNLSVWSDTVAAVPDGFAPEDITDLSVDSRSFGDGSNGCNDVTWNSAVDLVSGVKSYIVYRKEVSEVVYSAIDTVSGAEMVYCDTLSHFTVNKVYDYKVGSVDNVGNLRSAEQSSRTVRIRALIGPSVSADPTQTIECPNGLLGVSTDKVDISWANYDQTGIEGYELEITQPNAVKIRRIERDPGLQRFTCPLTAADGVYRLRVRAFYPNRDSTIFSNTILVKKKLSLSRVANLTAAHHDAQSGNIRLSWTHPDGDEIVSFRIFNWQDGGERPAGPTAILSGRQFEWIHAFETSGLSAYQCNYYSIQVTDCFGLQSEILPEVSQYPAPAPVFAPQRTIVSRESITVFWDRPSPRLRANDAFEVKVIVYRDVITGTPLDSSVAFNKTSFRLDNPTPGHNYIFNVRETILDNMGQSCSDSFVSSLSRNLVIPYENLPDPISFTAQPLPVLPDSEFGDIFLSWESVADGAVRRFLVKWHPVTQPTKIDSTEVVDIDTFLIRDLKTTDDYEFTIIAIDTLEQRSMVGISRVAGFAPRWVFTPKIQSFSPVAFKDSVRISWGWVDNSLEYTSSSFGADSILVELSIDPEFQFRKSTTRLGLIESYVFTRTRDYPFANDQNSRIFARIRAKDRWGHVSPWSTAYAELGAAEGAYDEVPPSVVTCGIDSVKAPLFGTLGEVNIHLRWPASTDQSSGTWFYEIARNDSVVARDTSRTQIHTFVDRKVLVDESLLSSLWTVHGVDSVGNRQKMATPARVAFMVEPPDSVWFTSDSTVCWSDAHTSIENSDIMYFVEGARFLSLLGNSVTNITAGPLSANCFNFDVPWEGIYWRVKARQGNIESAWSNVSHSVLIFLAGVTSVDLEAQTIPEDFALHQNYPNPFNPTTTITYAIPRVEGGAVDVVLEVFNINGQRIRTLVEESSVPGYHATEWDGRDQFGRQAGSGIYLYRMRAAEFVSTQRMMLLK